MRHIFAFAARMDRTPVLVEKNGDCFEACGEAGEIPTKNGNLRQENDQAGVARPRKQRLDRLPLSIDVNGMGMAAVVVAVPVLDLEIRHREQRLGRLKKIEETKIAFGIEIRAARI